MNLMLSMNLDFSLIDNRLLLENVETYVTEGSILAVVFTDGRRKNYPLEHILWYGEVNEKIMSKEFAWSIF